MAFQFQCGDQIEVSSKEDGYIGSYFAAKIISIAQTNNNSQKIKQSRFKNYVVEYKTLVTDDHSRPLQETVPGDEIRPIPPEIGPTSFRVADVVDVYDYDGWWMGTVTRVIAGFCCVYFDTTKEEIAYSFDRVRVHQDWINGRWIPSNSNNLIEA